MSTVEYASSRQPQAAGLEGWMDQTLAVISHKSDLGKAILYTGETLVSARCILSVVQLTANEQLQSLGRK